MPAVARAAVFHVARNPDKKFSSRSSEPAHDQTVSKSM
jgi:hypothetical protein